MALIEGGEFLMGSPASESESDEHPQHRVRVSTFCIDRTEVTVDAYRTCTKCTPPNAYRGERGSNSVFCTWGRPNAGNDPVNCVDWEQAKAFCESRGGSLPTEAQWEFAARGPEGRRYPWGREEPDATRANLCGEECTRFLAQHEFGTFTPIANWRDQFEGTAPVGSFSLGATPGTGLHDMAGNVWEWTADWYADHYETSDASLVVDPTGPVSGTDRVLRGGGWFNYSAAVARAAYRVINDPTARDFIIGFRCARGAR
jgi:formylglycine-generating enzyme required for sulfatase activity